MSDNAAAAVIGACSRLSTFAAGEAIMDQGQPCDRIGILVRGHVKVVHLTEDGDEQVLQLLRPGDMIGDPFGRESCVSWEAATDITLCSMPSHTLERISREHPALYRAYFAGAVHELEEQRLWSAAMRGRSTLQRLAYWLGRQPASASDDGAAVVEIRLSRRDLASLLDMSVETLCRSLHQVEQYGAIRLLTPNTVAVMSRPTLRRLSSVDEDIVAPQIRVKRRPRRTRKSAHSAPGAIRKGDCGTESGHHH